MMITMMELNLDKEEMLHINKKQDLEIQNNYQKKLKKH